MPTPPTIHDMCQGYLSHLNVTSREVGGFFVQELEFARIEEGLGRDTPLADLNEGRISRFFQSEDFLNTRAGRRRDLRALARTRTVLHSALSWAAGMEWLPHSLVEAATR